MSEQDFSPFDPDANRDDNARAFELYTKRFDQFLRYKKIVDNEEKASTFLYLVGEKVFNIYDNLTVDVEELKKDPYTTVINALKKTFFSARKLHSSSYKVS